MHCKNLQYFYQIEFNIDGTKCAVKKENIINLDKTDKDLLYIDTHGRDEYSNEANLNLILFKHMRITTQCIFNIKYVFVFISANLSKLINFYFS